MWFPNGTSSGRVDSRGEEQDQFGLSVAKLAVDGRTDRWFRQTFPTDTHETLGSAKSLWFPTRQQIQLATR